MDCKKALTDTVEINYNGVWTHHAIDGIFCHKYDIKCFTCDDYMIGFGLKCRRVWINDSLHNTHMFRCKTCDICTYVCADCVELTKEMPTTIGFILRVEKIASRNKNVVLDLFKKIKDDRAGLSHEGIIFKPSVDHMIGAEALLLYSQRQNDTKYFICEPCSNCLSYQASKRGKLPKFG